MEIKLWLDRLICLLDTQPESVYRFSCLASSLGLNRGDPEIPDVCVDVPPAEPAEAICGLQWAVNQVASVVFLSLSSSLYASQNMLT